MCSFRHLKGISTFGIGEDDGAGAAHGIGHNRDDKGIIRMVLPDRPAVKRSVKPFAFVKLSLVCLSRNPLYLR